MADEEDQRDHENLEALLNWLDPDRDEAWKKYEEIRKRLIKIFTWHKLPDAESFAAEVLERVEGKVTEVIRKFSKDDDPARYFYGVARNVALETFRNREKFSEFEEKHDRIFTPDDIRESRNLPDEDLDFCLEQLSERDRYIVLAYYQYDQKTKKADHDQLAEELGMSKSALWTKVSRIRSSLEKCLKAHSEPGGEAQ